MFLIEKAALAGRLCRGRFSALMGWKIIQTLTFAAVLASNIHYEWTPNPYAASVVALLGALLVTALLSWAFDLVRIVHGWQRRIATKKRGQNPLAITDRQRQ